jgi:hypothetical protein
MEGAELAAQREGGARDERAASRLEADQRGPVRAQSLLELIGGPWEIVDQARR